MRKCALWEKCDSNDGRQQRERQGSRGCFVGECGRGAQGETVRWLVCCRHAGGREAGWVFGNKGWGVPVTQNLAGIVSRRVVVLLLLLMERNLQFPRESQIGRIADREARAAPAPASLPGGLYTVEFGGTSLKRKRPPLGPYSRALPRALWHSLGGGCFLPARYPCTTFS